MRLAYGSLLALLCAGAGCIAAAGDDPPSCGGPTSDWPFRCEDESSEDSEEGAGVAPKPTDGSGNAGRDPSPSKGENDFDKRDAGKAMDAGKGPPSNGGEKPATPDGVERPDPPRSDAGAALPSDAAAPLTDAGPSPFDGGVVGDAGPSERDGGWGEGGLRDAGPLVPPVCTIDSSPRTQDACGGWYCDLMASDMLQRSSARGACIDEHERALACSGDIGRVVAGCAQDDALMLGLGYSVSRCAQRSDALAGVAAECIDCYVEEVICSTRNCFASCLTGSASECSSCRLERCAAAFSTCSGLPAPNQHSFRSR